MTIMKKSIFASLALLACVASSCGDDYNDKFDIEHVITDVKNVTMTLSSSDYAIIASNATNKQLALAKDPEGQTGLAALEAVAKNKYFTAEAPADEYLPAFLAAKYPQADLTSKFTVTYNQYQAPATYLADFSKVSTYTLTSEDYEGVWGDKVKASFLSPASVGKISSILENSMADAEAGDMVVVNYAYSDVEPSIGGGSASSEPTWTQIETIPVRSAGTSWDFVNMGPVDLSAYKGQTVNVAFKYTSSTSACATWEVKNFKALSVPYLDVVLFAKQDDGTFKKVTKKAGFTGAGEWVIAALGADGNYYPFGRLKGDSYSYGYMYPAAIAVTDGVITADDAADFVITLEETEAGYTMKNAIGKYIYMSGNYNSFNVSDEAGTEGYDWTIASAGGADLFTITNVAVEKTVKLNYYNGSYSYGGYPASSVEAKTYVENTLCGDEGGFTTYDIDLAGLSYVWQNTSNYGWKASAYVNSVKNATETYLVSPAIEIAEDAALPYFTIDEAFQHGTVDQLTVWVSTDYAASAVAAASTRASVAANASVLYRYDGSAWFEYTNSDVKVAVVEPEVYASVGASSISAEELPAYLANKYPYAVEGDRVVVVYNQSSTKVAAEEYTKLGAEWVVTPTSTAETLTFTIDKDGISAKISVYLDDSLLGSEGGFVAQDVTLTGGLSYVWLNTSSYGWKASSYMNSANNQAESWLVSPSFDFRKGTAPVLTFEEAINYMNGEDVNAYCMVKISTDYKDDVTKATWTNITLPQRADGASWTFVSVGDVDLSAYIGNITRIAFVYNVPANSPVGPTWEFKNILVKEKDAE